MMKFSLPWIAVLACLGLALSVRAQPDAPQSRGEMLYTTYCIECHRAQIHWRQNSLVSDWTSLYAQVRRWQENSGRSWDAGDTAALARFLNDRYYRLPAGEGFPD